MLVILVGGSCVGKTTIEKLLVKKGFIPLTIYTTREKREDDPSWVYRISPNFNPNTNDFYKIKGVNNHNYFIKKGTKSGTKYITSIIDVEHARKLAESHVGKVNTIMLTRPNKEILKCLYNRDITDEEIYDRYNQYLEMKDSGVSTLESSKAIQVITNLHI